MGASKSDTDDIGELNRVAINGDTIHVTISGSQPKAIAHAMRSRFRHAVESVASKHPKVYVVVDVRKLGIGDINSDSRLSMKDALQQPYYRLAVIGRSHLIETALYLIRSGDAVKKARYFTSERKAHAWLKRVRSAKQKRSRTPLVLATLMGLIGAASLVGWARDEAVLKPIFNDVRLMNPVAACVLIALAGSVIGWWTGKRTWQRVFGLAVLVVSVAAVAPIEIDYLLFAEKVRAGGAHALFPNSLAWGFMLATPATLLLDGKGVAAKVITVLCGSGIFFLSFFNLFGILYAAEALSADNPLAMTFNSALGLALFGTIVAAVFARQIERAEYRTGRIGALIVATLLLVQAGTYGSWQQSIERNKTDASQAFDAYKLNFQRTTQERIRAYIDTIGGFRGLFASSDYVTQGEFEAYYDAVDTKEKYPELRALSYIARVPEEGLADFIELRRKDTSILPEGNGSFDIPVPADQPTHFIVTYIAGDPTSASIGIDLAAIESRKLAFERAQSQGAPIASGTVTFNVTDTSDGQKGFFITTPIRATSTTEGAENPDYIGFVNAVLNYDDFFAALFKGSQLLQDISVEVIDDNVTIFSANKTPNKALHDTFNVSVADRTWRVTLDAPENYSISDNQANFPSLILFSGQLLSLLLLVLFFILAQSRRRAMRLAGTITADLQKERNLAVSLKQKDEAILSSIGDAVFAVDNELRITLFNQAAEEISGYSAEEVLGKPYSQVLDFRIAKTDEPSISFIEKAAKGEVASMQNHTYLVTKDGRHVSVADSAAPIRDGSDTILGVIVIFRDVSKEEELDRAKTEFVSLASHQLRTPLSAINWYTEMLLEEDSRLSKQQKDYAMEIYQGNQRMVELVNSLLDVSRLDLGKLTNDPKPTSMDELLESIQKELSGTIKSKQQVLELHVDNPLKPVHADPKLLRMIVQNLLSNAVKYTPEKGTITVELHLATKEEKQSAKLQRLEADCVYFSVTDTGYGIPKSQHDKIFGKLFRADNVRKMDKEGTGLGLYIVKQVTEQLHGRIWFESVEKKGSTFYVVLPIKSHNKSKEER